MATRDGRFQTYSYARYVGQLAWQVLYETGHFPPSTPRTLRSALRTGPLTIPEMVDHYGVANADVRQMFIDYLERRSADITYGTLRTLARALLLQFWRRVEAITPTQADLRLSEDTYQRWRAGVGYRDDGRPRSDVDGIIVVVRGLYYDIQVWAAQEPEHWARWVAPCPVPKGEIRAGIQRRRRTRERMADRTRVRQPLLPLLVASLESDLTRLTELLKTGAAAEPTDLVTYRGRVYRRLFTRGDANRLRIHNNVNIRVEDVATGEVINVTAEEDVAFWNWAVVETLRHSGVRLAEMLDLTQLSIRQYQRPNGDVIALLVIAPSKTDRERVIPMSAELFHVIASIIRRLADERGVVRLATRYNKERFMTSVPQPFLFQRRIGQRNEVMTETGTNQMLGRTSKRLAREHPEIAEHRFTPHDFRRLFATDLVNHGLPIHIGAALLGHLNIETTRGYVAVFEEDLVRHYQEHLARRRAQRPQEEYRPVTDAEWVEFDEHFDKRKVELGNCGRPYATPCVHEHACVRCPMLRIDAKMLPRLDDLEADLLARRARAEAEGWLGEIEGIYLTLTFLRDKRAQAQRLARRGLIQLGSPPASARAV
jgi:site-specific recombinase XerD